ncbi:MAG: hypothetical protein ACC707_12100 [Thiohalomonadales bacterium]
MKIKRKPDLLLILALFVFIGVVVSTQTPTETHPRNIEEQDATVPIRTQNNDGRQMYRSHFLHVSAQVDRQAIL